MEKAFDTLLHKTLILLVNTNAGRTEWQGCTQQISMLEHKKG